MLGLDRVSLKSVAAFQAGTVVVLSAVMVWSSLALTSPPRGAGPDAAEVRRTSEAFAGALTAHRTDRRATQGSECATVS